MDYDRNLSSSSIVYIINIIIAITGNGNGRKKGRIRRTWDTFYLCILETTGMHHANSDSLRTHHTRSRLVHREFTIIRNPMIPSECISKSVCHGQELFDSSPEFFGRSTMPGTVNQVVGHWRKTAGKRRLCVLILSSITANANAIPLLYRYDVGPKRLALADPARHLPFTIYHLPFTIYSWFEVRNNTYRTQRFSQHSLCLCVRWHHYILCIILCTSGFVVSTVTNPRWWPIGNAMHIPLESKYYSFTCESCPVLPPILFQPLIEAGQT